MIKHKDKSWYIWQNLSEVWFNERDSMRGYYEDTSDLRKIKFRLGELIIIFNHLEYELENALCDILWHWREDETGMMIIWNMKYKQKCTLLKNYQSRSIILINKKTNKKLKNKLRKVVEKLLLAWEIRNACVHAHRYDRQEKWSVRIKTKFDENGVKIIYREIDIKTLDKYINFIQNLEYELDSLNEEINGFIYN